ncbi:uncharacterized protein LOC111310668 [Durio zibethinus]|uniref:Uncharacterized protein LOC111310668 n=1 Tax=Durio zibethinus TaxID=66656 RepID=A0A6P6ALY5_DURZI|nr:uncharacterized protein LOC111310668 [Durio zibethinus]
MRNPYASMSFINEERPGLHGTVTERIFGSNSSNWTNYNFRMGTYSFNALPSWKSHKLKNEFSSSHNLESFHTWSRLGPIGLNPVSQTQAKAEDHTNFSRSNGPSDLNKPNQQDFKAMKRKTSDCNLDLDLSLRLTQVNQANQRNSMEDNVGSELSLSLYSPSSLKLSRLKGDDHTKESARRTAITMSCWQEIGAEGSYISFHKMLIIRDRSKTTMYIKSRNFAYAYGLKQNSNDSRACLIPLLFEIILKFRVQGTVMELYFENRKETTCEY